MSKSKIFKILPPKIKKKSSSRLPLLQVQVQLLPRLRRTTLNPMLTLSGPLILPNLLKDVHQWSEMQNNENVLLLTSPTKKNVRNTKMLRLQGGIETRRRPNNATSKTKSKV